jgi:hypothetical protein
VYPQCPDFSLSRICGESSPGEAICKDLVDGKVKLDELYKHRDSEAAKLGLSMKSKKGDAGVLKRPAAVARDDSDDDADDLAPLVPPKHGKKVVRRKPAAPSVDGDILESDVSDSSGTEEDMVSGIGLGDPPALGFFEEAQLLM